jgi:hypothetical protein
VRIFQEATEKLPENTRTEDRDLVWRLKHSTSDENPVKVSAWDLFNFCFSAIEDLNEKEKEFYKLYQENYELKRKLTALKQIHYAKYHEELEEKLKIQ